MIYNCLFFLQHQSALARPVFQPHLSHKRAHYGVHGNFVALKTVHQFSSSGVDIDRAYEDLKVECACVSNTAWIEADIEPEYGMTLIPESNRIT